MMTPNFSGQLREVLKLSSFFANFSQILRQRNRNVQTRPIRASHAPLLPQSGSLAYGDVIREWRLQVHVSVEAVVIADHRDVSNNICVLVEVQL